jgi:hypothetical protein
LKTLADVTATAEPPTANDAPAAALGSAVPKPAAAAELPPRAPPIAVDVAVLDALAAVTAVALAALATALVTETPTAAPTAVATLINDSFDGSSNAAEPNSSSSKAS